MLFNKDTKLVDLVKVYKNAIPKELCSDIITKSSSFNWSKNTWRPDKYRQLNKPDSNLEPDRATIDKDSQVKAGLLIETYANLYVKEVRVPFQFEIKKFDTPDIIRYSSGTRMLPHHDHADAVGIPILSTIGLLNDDFEGGEFIFWDNLDIKLEAGDMLLFPTLFAYTHQINTITKGTRYSLVSWVY